jgi:hypothetical protein
MGRKRKNERRELKREPPNQEILDSIGSPNPWTPAREDKWLKELGCLSAVEIYSRYPPIKKPPNVRKRGRGFGWGG